MNNDQRKRAASPVGGDDLTDDLFDNIRKYIYQSARISLGENKRELVRARFGKVIRQRKMSGFHEYFDWMKNDTTGEAMREALNAIATNLTSFFRENQHFQYIADTLIPRIAASGRKRIRGWSAGCSTGEEVYTIGITLLENIPDHGRWDIRLLATDLDTEVVANGQQGLYAKERLHGVSPVIIKRYFDPTSDEKGRPAYQARQALRNLVSFRYLNLFSDWPFRNKLTFIFCRNVMIYFDRETQELLINRFYDQLESGGHLFIGHSESLSGIKHRFEYSQPTVYIRN